MTLSPLALLIIVLHVVVNDLIGPTLYNHHFLGHWWSFMSSYSHNLLLCDGEGVAGEQFLRE